MRKAIFYLATAFAGCVAFIGTATTKAGEEIPDILIDQFEYQAITRAKKTALLLRLPTRVQCVEQASGGVTKGTLERSIRGLTPFDEWRGYSRQSNGIRFSASVLPFNPADTENPCYLESLKSQSKSGDSPKVCVVRLDRIPNAPPQTIAIPHLCNVDATSDKAYLQCESDAFASFAMELEGDYLEVPTLKSSMAARAFGVSLSGGKCTLDR